MMRKIVFGLWVAIVSIVSILAGFIGALIFIPHLTVNLTLSIILSLLLIYIAAFVLLFFLAKRLFKEPGRKVGLLAALPVLFVVLFYAVPNIAMLMEQPVPVDNDLIVALNSHVIPLASVDSTELDSLRPLLENRQVVALGEATHGTSEFFRMKHSLIAYLVTDLGFRNYGMEISSQDGELLNRYIHGEDVDPASVLYWPWATEEVLAMLDWMRLHNAGADPANQLTIFGIDPREGARDRIMAENVKQIVASHGPIVLWAHNDHISAKEGSMGAYLKESFGTDAYLIGFEFSEGTFTSRTDKIDIFAVNAAPPTFYAYALSMLDEPLLFLDMATMQQVPLLDEWLNTPQRTHQIAELYHLGRLLPGTRTSSYPLPDLYDALIFVEKSSPTVVLPNVK